MCDADNDMNTTLAKPKTRRKRIVTEEYVTLGAHAAKCSFCNVQMWKEERVKIRMLPKVLLYSLFGV